MGDSVAFDTEFISEDSGFGGVAYDPLSRYTPMINIVSVDGRLYFPATVIQAKYADHLRPLQNELLTVAKSVGRLRFMDGNYVPRFLTGWVTGRGPNRFFISSSQGLDH